MPVQSPNKPKVPLRVVLILPFVLQLTLVAGLVGYLSFRNGQKAVNDVAHQLRSEITARIEDHLRTFLETPHQINRINAHAIQQGVLDIGDPVAMERYLWEQIQAFDSVTSIYFGNAAGGLVNAGREGSDDLLYVINTEGFEKGPFNKYATDPAGNRTDLLVTIPDFDARTRPWYTSAVEKGDATWSDVYILFTGQDMAIAASQPVYDNQRRLLGVVSIDIFTSHLADFLKRLEIGKTGQSFIMERSGLLVASSTEESPFTTPDGEGTQRRLHAYESRVPMIRSAAEVLADRFGDYANITDAQQVEFEIEGQRQFMQVSSFQDKYGIDWFIVVVVPESDFMAQIRANNRITAFLIGVASLIAVVLGVITTRWVTGPILRLNASAQALANGEWEHTVDVDWIDEISTLTLSFNYMAEQLKQMLENLMSEIAQRNQAQEALQASNRRLEETLVELKAVQEQMMQQERLAAVGQLAAGIAHDFNNIMATIVLYAQMTLRVPDLPPYIQDRMAAINQQAQHATQLIQQILDFSRRAVLDRQRLDLLSLLQEQIRLLRRMLPERIALNLDYGRDTYFIYADPTRIKQVVMNLAINARDAMPEGGELHFKLDCVEVGLGDSVPLPGMKEGPWVKLTVSDTGMGIPPEVLPHVFEPFFTTRAPLGSGLGLAQVHGIVAQHGGYIGVETQVGSGTAFVLYFPALQVEEEMPSSTEAPVLPELPKGHGERLLVVEDEPAVRKALAESLGLLGYCALEAGNGEEALAVLEQHSDEVVLLLSDVVMPGMGGVALIRVLRERGLTIPVIMLSGHPMEGELEDLKGREAFSWLLKPPSLEGLAQEIARLLSRS